MNEKEYEKGDCSLANLVAARGEIVAERLSRQGCHVITKAAVNSL